MTNVVRGSVATLSAEFREFAPNGPLTNINGISITIVPLLGGAAALAQTSVGITNPATGLYGYQWSVPASLDAGQYVVIWAGTEIGSGDPVSATEQITVTFSSVSATAEPCNWEIDVGCCSDWSTFSAETQELAFTLATSVLWAATGRRFGMCEITVQPCRQRKRLPLYEAFPVPGWGYGTGYSDGVGFGPFISDGQWFNACWGGCRCRSSCEIALDGPTTTDNVISVSVAGEVVAPSAYQIQDGHLLVRIDGQCWPTCVDYSQQSPPEFTVTYRRGDPQPGALKIAGGILACEFAKACERLDDCRLPSRLTSLARQGVSVEVGQVTNYLDMGLTEIPEVDQVIVNLNPYRQQERSRIYSVDRPRPRQVT